MKNLTLILIVAAFLGSLNVMADEKKEIKKTFDAKENLTVKLSSSDCEITKGDDNKEQRLERVVPQETVAKELVKAFRANSVRALDLFEEHHDQDVPDNLGLYGR